MRSHASYVKTSVMYTQFLDQRYMVMKALSKVFCPWELLYVDDLAIFSDSLVDLKNRFPPWKTSLESHQ